MMCKSLMLLIVIELAAGFDMIQPILRYRIAGDTKCARQLNELKSGFMSGSYWALKMVDSSAKLQSGLLDGNLIQFGSFDGCMSTHSIENNIKGKYCLARIPFAKLETISKHFGFHFADNKMFAKLKNSTTFGLVYGMCIPDGCQADEVTSLSRENLVFADFVCQSADDYPGMMTYTEYFATAFFLVLILIISASTFYDLHLEYNNKEADNRLYVAFSFYTNVKSLFKTNRPSNLGFINGIRSISMIWIVIGHMYSHLYMWGSSNSVDILTFFGKKQSMLLLSAHFSVDTFLFLSGLLVTYAYLKAEKFSTPAFYIHRYLRLTVPLAAMVLFHLSYVKYFINGPLAPIGRTMYVQNCQDYWWSCLLHVQNWINPDNMCTPTSWYLSVEMQLVLIAPLILTYLKKYPKRTLALIGFLVCVIAGITFWIVWIYEIGAIYNIFDQDSAFNRQYYFPTYTRASPWLIGIVAGYLIYQARSQQVNINKTLVISAWISSLGIMLYTMLAGHVLLFPEEYVPLAHTAYLAFGKIIWAITLGWVVFACATGHGGPIKWFLSLRVFDVLSKISYSINLVHYTLFGILLFSKKETTIFSNGRVMYDFCGHFVVILALSTFWHLCFEKPLIEIEASMKEKLDVKKTK